MATGTIKIGHNYLNNYEYYHNMLKGNPLFKEADWTNAYNNNSLPELIAMMTDKSTPDLSTLENEYGYDFLDAERRQIALYNELYGNKVDALTITEKYIDDNGIEQERTFDTTQYEHTKKLLQQARDYELAQLQLEKEQEAKDEISDFTKTLKTIGAIPRNLLGGVLNVASGLTNIVEGVFDGVTASIKGESFDKAFRNAFDNVDFADEYQEWLVNWERENSYTRDIYGNYTPIGKVVGGVSTSIGEMLPTLALTMITTGATNSLANAGKISTSTAASISNNVGKASKVIYYTGMGSNTFKELSREMPTVPTIKLIANSAAKTVAEAAIEKALGEAFGPSNMDKMHFNYAPAGTKQFVAKNVLSSYAKDFIQEGTEELVQEFSGYLIDRFFAISDNKFGDASDWNFQTMLDAFILGGLSTVAMNSFDIITTKRVITSDTSYDKKGNLRQTKDGVNIPTRLNKAQSWLYKQNLSNMFAAYDEAINSKDLTLSQRSAALGQMYASYRVISSFYGEIGEKRFTSAVKMLEEINNSLPVNMATPLAESKSKLTKVNEIDGITAAANILAAQVSDGKYSLKAEYAKSLLEKSKATKINSVVNKNKTTLEGKSDNVKKVVDESFKRDDSLKSVVLTDDGQRPAEEDGVLLVPLQLAELGDTELVYEMISETLLKDMLESEKVFAPLLKNFVKVYSDTYGVATPNNVEVIYNLLFNDKFFNILLYSSNKETLRFLDSLGEIVDNLSSKNFKEEMFKYTASKTYKAMLKQLIEYCVNQQNIVLETMKSLSPEAIRWIKDKRYSKDLANRLVSINGINEITKGERDMLTNKINSLAVDKNTKEKLLTDIFSLNSAARKTALETLNVFYRNLYFGPYNNVIYKNPKFVGDVVFNQFLIELGLDMQTVLNPDNYTGTLKEEFDSYKETGNGTAYDFIKNKFEDFTGNVFSVSDNFDITTDVELDLPMTYSTKDIMSSEEQEQVFAAFHHFKIKLFEGILNPLPDTLASYVTIADIISNPSKYINLKQLNNYLHKNGILDTDKNIDDYTKNVYAFYRLLNQYLAHSTNGKFSIIQLPNNDFTLIRCEKLSNVIDMDTVRDTFAKVKDHKNVTLGDMLKKKFATSKIRNAPIKAIIMSNKDKLAYYDRNDNTVYVNADTIADKKLTLNEFVNLIGHELYHIYSLEAANMYGATAYELSKDVLTNIGKHMIEDIGETFESQDLYYYTTGELLANGELPMDITFARTNTGVVTPWGDEYFLAKSGKPTPKLITKKEIAAGKKPMYDTGNISSKEAYVPATYRKFFADKLEAEGFKILYESKGYKAEVSEHNNGYVVKYRKLTKAELPEKSQETNEELTPAKSTLKELNAEDVEIKYVNKKSDTNKTEKSTEKPAENKVFDAGDAKSVDENLNVVEYTYQRSFNKKVDAQTFVILQEDKGYSTKLLEQDNKYIVKFGRPEKIKLSKKKPKALTAEDRKALTKQRFLNKPFRLSQATTHTRRVSQEKAEKYSNLKYYVDKPLGPSLQTLLMNFDYKKAKATGQDLTAAKALYEAIKSGTIVMDNVFSLLRDSEDMDDHTFLVINHAYFRNPYISTFSDLKKLDAFSVQAKALKVTLQQWVDNSTGEEYKIAKSYLDSTSKQMTIDSMERLANKVLEDPKLKRMYDRNLAYQQKFHTQSTHVQIIERFDYTIDRLVWAFDTMKKVEYSDFSTSSKKREKSLDDDDTNPANKADPNALEGFSVLTADLDKMEEDLLYYAGEYDRATNPKSTKESVNKAKAEFYTKMYGDGGSNEGMSEAKIRGLWVSVTKVLELTNFYTSRYIKENPNLDTKSYEAARLKYLRTLSRYDNAQLNTLYEKFTLSKYSSKGTIGFGSSPDKTITSIVKAKERSRNNILQNVNKYKNTILSTLNSTGREVRTKFMKDPKNTEYFEMDGKGLIHFKTGILRTADNRPTHLKVEQLLVVEEELKPIAQSINRGVYANAEHKKQISKLEKDLAREKNKRLAAEENAKRYKEKLSDEKIKFKTINAKLGPANFNISFNNIDYNSETDSPHDKIQSVPEPLKEILSFSFTKFEKSTIKYSDEDNMVMNGKVFFRENAEVLSRLTEQDIVDIIGFYKNSSIDRNSIDINDLRKYEAFKHYILQYFAKEHHDSTSFLTLSSDMLKDIKTITTRDQNVAGTVLSISRKTMEAIDPVQTMAAKLTTIAGIELSEAEVKDIIKTIEQTDFADKKSVSALTDKFEQYYMKAAERSIDTPLLEKLKELDDNNDRFNAILTAMGGLTERWWRFQRMAMLSSPGTWIRNWTSNITITTASKFADKLGEWTAETLGSKNGKNKLIDGQWQVANVEVSEEVSGYTNTVFVESGLINYIGIASKYDNISNKTGDKLIALIKSSLDNKLFHMNQFKSKRLNKFANFIYSKIDDSKFVRKTAIKYFNSMLQQYSESLKPEQREKLFDTTQIPVEVLNIFADAYTLASYEYMHRPNIFSDIEKIIREHVPAPVYFVYKQIFPFASSGWNWFVEGLKYTPFGLVSAIYRFNNLENTIDKMKAKHAKDGRLPSDSFAQYLIKKDLGKGVIGSIGFVIGIILYAVGLVGIEEDEYDKTLKIKLGDLYVDISDVFGTQSIFLGMATMSSIMKAAGDDPYDILDFTSDFLNQMFMESTLGDVFNIFRYDETLGEYVTNHLDDSLKMFVLNMILTFSSVVYVNKVQYGTGWENMGRRIAGYIPFVNYAQPYRYDPYTGEKQVKYSGYWLSDIALDALNKLSPVKFNYHKISEAEKLATSVGVRRKELTGKYKINDESVNLNAVQLSALNKYYGELNAKELNLLFNNKKVYKVWNDEKKIYQTIRYSKMNNEQKKSVIERIMNDNASVAKVYILTNNGYRYYTSEAEVAYLKSLGIKNVYIKTKKKEGYIK